MSYYYISAYSSGLLFLTAYVLATSHIVISHKHNSYVLFFCDRTEFYEFCKRTLYSDPRSEKASLYDIAMISVDISYENAHSNINKILSDMQKIEDVARINSLISCRNTFQTVVDDMPDIRAYWVHFNFEKARDDLKKIIGLLKQCKTQLYKMDHPIKGQVVTMNRLLMMLVEACNLGIISGFW